MKEHNDGRAEEIIGRLLRSCRDRVVLATKAYYSTRPGPNARGNSRFHRQARYREASNGATAETFTNLAAQLGFRPAALAVAWTASHPAVSSVLLGARNVAQIEETLAVADLVLDPEIQARVASLTSRPPKTTDRSEEQPALNSQNANSSTAIAAP